VNQVSVNQPSKRNQLNATIAKKSALTDSLFIIEIAPDFEVPDFKPGQYVALGLPAEEQNIEAQSSSDQNMARVKRDRLIKRTYSIASSPSYKDGVEFYIALVPGGELTPALLSLEIGERLFMAPKITGTFVLDPVPDGMNLIFVSTGTGIAPFISMLRSREQISRFASISLFHGVRYESDLAYRDELLELEESHSNFSYHSTISRPGADWSGQQGYVQQLLFENKELDPPEQHVFLCGNPAMIDDLEIKLKELGFALHSRRVAGNLHLEKYW